VQQHRNATAASTFEKQADAAGIDAGHGRVKARGQRDLITVIGHAAMISAGEFVQASGNWINDRTHGVQFRASFLRATAPATIEGIEKYLGAGMIRGIGPVYAKKLVRAFGEAVFEVIAQEPGRLREMSANASVCGRVPWIH
jgi:exodeoxyribonuclease V alpha subunit